MNRRQLLKNTGLAAAVAQTAGSNQGARAAASDRIGVGLIGCGNQGTWDQRSFMEQPDVEFVAFSDVYEPNLLRNQKMAGGKAKMYRDYRQLLEDKNVQAVLIATPEHWHAMMTIDACNAGKDVYVEKPASHNIRDGRLAVEAARRNNRVVQVGSQQRSGTHFQRAVKYVHDGRLGVIRYVICWFHAGSRPETRTAANPSGPATPPADLNFDLWLGPAPQRPVAQIWPGGRNRYWDYYGGSMTEWGAHLVDVARWGMKAQGPRSVMALGAQYARPDSEIPDTLQALFEFDGWLFQYSVLSHNSFGPNGDPGANRQGSYGIQFHGSKGTLFVDRAGFRLTPQYVRVEEPNHAARPAVWSQDERQLGYFYTTETLPESGDSSLQHQAHSRNFLDCVKSRQRPNADIEEGHYSNTICRLGNIAYRLGRKVQWDNAKEQAIGDPEVNKLAIGEYRAPWVPKGL